MKTSAIEEFRTTGDAVEKTDAARGDVAETNVARDADAPVESDAAAVDVSARRVKTKLVIATFNIRYAVGAHLISGSLLRRIGLSRPARRPRLVARNIQRAARALSDGKRMPPADIIALQEADYRTKRAGFHHIASLLMIHLDSAMCERGGLFYNDLPGMRSDDSKLFVRIDDEKPSRSAHAVLRAGGGNPFENWRAGDSSSAKDGESPRKARKQWYLDFEEELAPNEMSALVLISRFPMHNQTRINLPGADCAWRPRRALAATFRVGEKRTPLHVTNAHIDPHATVEEQLAQYQALLDYADTYDEREPVVLLGDFNTLSRRSRREMRALLESRGFRTPFKTGVTTWRAGLIRLHADWIFVREGRSVDEKESIKARVMRRGVARGLRVSDHFPVWIELEIEA